MSLGTTKLSVYICLSWSGIIPFGFRTEFNLNEIPDTNHITGFVDSPFETAESQYRNRKFNGSTVPAESCRTVDRDDHGRSGPANFSGLVFFLVVWS